MPKSSSSSSDEEEDLRLQQLREATVTFEALKNPIVDKKIEKPKSKRQQEPEEDPNNVCDVTPEFQEFVAKKLRKKLDESIELVTETPNKIKKRSDDDGFKFEIVKNVYFTNDDDNKNEEEVNGKSHKKHKKKKKKSKKSDSESDSDEDLNMLKEAAININFLAKTTCIEKHKKEFLNKD